VLCWLYAPPAKEKEKSLDEETVGREIQFHFRSDYFDFLFWALGLARSSLVSSTLFGNIRNHSSNSD
jgi:hypothetical protein